MVCCSLVLPIGRGSTGLPGRYSPFLKRQEADLKAFHEDEDLALDPRLDYSGISGISAEVKEKLAVIRPTTIVSGSTRFMYGVLMSITGCC